MPRPSVARVVPALAALLVGCSSPGTPSSAGGPSPAPGVPASAHVHGVAYDPADGALLLATHAGLFRVEDGGEPVQVGPVLDLMGFTVAGPGRYLASGHPGLHVDLPQPVGLIESADGGRTWTPVSRQGRSDFHALTAGPAGIVGFDGSLLRSTDGRQWEELPIPAEPHTLAAAPAGAAVLATTAQGLLLSSDGGTTWAPLDAAPLLQVVAWTGDGTGVVGVDPAGTVWAGDDPAGPWEERARLGTPPQALTAEASGGGVRVAVATGEGLLESEDGGRSFAVVLEH